MKIILTEQQAKNLIEGIGSKILSTVGNKVLGDKSGDTGDAFSSLADIDVEKTAPHLAQAMKSFTNMNPIDMAKKAGGLFTGGKFASNIPTGDEPMNPLGHKEPITSNFGHRNTGIAGASTEHKGIDMSTPSGSPVYAPLDGVVISSRDTTPNPCGGFIQLSHTNMKTKFCHLRQMIVKQGDKVKKGQLIGYTGGGKNDPMHGIASGPHLHYEILDRSGMAEDPLSVQPNLA